MWSSVGPISIFRYLNPRFLLPFFKPLLKSYSIKVRFELQLLPSAFNNFTLNWLIAISHLFYRGVLTNEEVYTAYNFIQRSLRGQYIPSLRPCLYIIYTLPSRSLSILSLPTIASCLLPRIDPYNGQMEPAMEAI